MLKYFSARESWQNSGGGFNNYKSVIEHVSVTDVEAKILTMLKQFVDKKPLTTCKITKQGLTALKEYLNMVEEITKRTK